MVSIIPDKTSSISSQPDNSRSAPTYIDQVNLPRLQCSDPRIEQAFRTAVGDVLGNVALWQDWRGVTRPTVLAGIHYDRPWTRDAAINSWNALSIIWPQLAEQTLLAVLTEDEHGQRIGGQYWDAIIWAQAAWHHYQVTGNRHLLQQAFTAIQNSLHYFEKTEFDPADNLFRGGGCFFDGIAAYPDRYSNNGPTGCWSPGLVGWSERNPQLRHPTGEGFPVKTLSTNCLYARAYALLPRLAEVLGEAVNPRWLTQAESLQQAIHNVFGDGTEGTLHYLHDDHETDTKQEGLGYAFAILFDLISPESQQKLVDKAYRSPHGIPSLYPDYDRYTNLGAGKYGRHGSTVWPHVNAMWASACVKAGQRQSAWHEVQVLTDKVCRDGHFAEIYHPDSGQRYGGEQEAPSIKDYKTWDSEARQTWCATGYIRMILDTIFGLHYDSVGISGDVWLPDTIEHCTLSGLQWQGQTLTLTAIKGQQLIIEYT